MQKLIVAMALTAGLAGVANASVWDGGAGDGLFNSALNWDDDAVPASGGTHDVNGNYTVERSADSATGRFFVRGGATVNINGGIHDANISNANRWELYGLNSAGYVNQSGGTNQMAHGVRLGTADNAGSDGRYNLTGGLLNIYGTANSSIFTANPGGRPSLEVGSNGAGLGLFEISGGSTKTRGGVHIGSAGTFSVKGSGATTIGIGSQSSLDGTWHQNGTLKLAVDSGGLTKILVDEVDGDAGQQATFYAGSLLDVGYDTGFSGPGTWTVLELENADIVNSGLAFAAGVDTDIWSFNIDNTGTNGILTVTAIPEPATLGLVAAFGGAVLFIRRRFMI